MSRRCVTATSRSRCTPTRRSTATTAGGRTVPRECPVRLGRARPDRRRDAAARGGAREAPPRARAVPARRGRLEPAGRGARRPRALPHGRAGSPRRDADGREGPPRAGVALAAVVDADGLSLPDFRAEERTFQLVAQLAGRSGRDAPGRVLVQTFQPDATPLRHAVNHDVAGFSPGARAARGARLPALRHLVSILVSGPEQGAPLAALRELRARLEGVDAVLLGPAPVLRLAAPPRPASREDDANPFGRRHASALLAAAARTMRRDGPTAVVDVDPQSM